MADLEALDDQKMDSEQPLNGSSAEDPIGSIDDSIEVNQIVENNTVAVNVSASTVNAAKDEIAAEVNGRGASDQENPNPENFVNAERTQEDGDASEGNANPAESSEMAVLNHDAEQPEHINAKANGNTKDKAATNSKKFIFIGLAAVALIAIAILMLVNTGPKLDASARLGQVSINYPSDWTFNGEDRTIFVDEDDVEGGVIYWATSGDYRGSDGVDAFKDALSDSIVFKGTLDEVDIDGVTAYRQAASMGSLAGEALFVVTDEGTTFVIAAMPSDDENLQKTLVGVLDSAVLTPGTKLTITLKMDDSTTDTVVVYDYGSGAKLTVDVNGASNDKKIPTSGEVLTSWESDEPNVNAVLNDEGDWEISGVTSDVTLNAIWTAAHKVTFTDGEGGEIAKVGVLDGEAADAPEKPTRKGFAFDGWDADFSKVTDDITVNAKWVEAHTVTFTDGMGNTLAKIVVKDGESAKAPDEPTRSGYTFSGWDADFSKVTNDATVNARWDSEFKAALRDFGDFKQETVSGTGDDVIDIPCAGKPCIMIISNDGSRNFVVKTLDSSGDSVDLLVNTIGSYNGTVTTYLDYEDSQLVEVKSSGNWTITFAPLADMPDATSGTSFSGDNVVAISEESLIKVHFSNNGPSNFVVKGIGYGASKLLVNEIGDYDGTVAWSEPQCFFIVESSGTWSISW